MNRIDELTATVSALRTELLDLDAVEAPSEEQVARSTAALAEYDTASEALTVERARVAKMDAVRAAIDNPKQRENGFGGVNVNVKRDPFENLGALRSTAPDDDDVIARAVTALSETRSAYTTDEHRQSAVRLVERLPGAAHHALIFGSPIYRSAFEETMRALGKGRIPNLSPEQAEAMRFAEQFDSGEVSRADYSLTNAAGGYMLPTLLDPTLILTGVATKNPLRRIARVEQITQNVWHGVSAGNVTAYWTAEAAAMTAGNSTLSNPSVTAAKLTAYLPASYEIFEDSNLQAQLPAAIAEGMDFVEGTAFISGSGSGAPKGIITAISATAGSTVTATTRGSFTSASYVDVYAVVNAVSPRFEESVTWVGNKATFNLINTMSPSGGGSLYWGNFDQAGFVKPPLLGSPVVTASDVSAATTSGTIIAILGDFSRYLIADRIGTQVEYIQNVVNNAGVPTGERALVAHRRVGADCLDINAFRFLKT